LDVKGEEMKGADFDETDTKLLLKDRVGYGSRMEGKKQFAEREVDTT